MPIGNPDWYRSGQSATVQSGIDTHELAVRLGSEVNYDRTGKVMFRDVFTRFDGLYVVTKNLITSGPLPDTIKAEYGGSSAKTVHQANNNAWVLIERSLRSWDGAKISAEIGLHTTRIPTQVILRMYQNFNNMQYQAECGFDTTGTRIYYKNSAGVSTELLTYASSPWQFLMFHALKMDLDLSLGQYARIRFNNKLFDMTGIPIQQGGGAGPERLIVQLAIYGTVAGAMDSHLDRIVITEDE